MLITMSNARDPEMVNPALKLSAVPFCSKRVSFRDNSYIRLLFSAPDSFSLERNKRRIMNLTLDLHPAAIGRPAQPPGS